MNGRAFLFSLIATSGVVIVHPAGAQDFARIRVENEDSVVHIHSQKSRKDGAGVPEHRFGSGFIVSSTGHVLTANHVILQPDSDSVVTTTAAVRSRHNPRLPLEFIKADRDLDVALLVLPDTGTRWKPVRKGDSRGTPRDALLYALGFPGNLDLSPATGILSTKVARRGYWQTTLAINKGQSGGPIFDMSGNWVAIGVAGDETQQQVTFAIPSAYADGLLQLAANSAVSSGLAMLTASKSSVTKTFQFYDSVMSDKSAEPSEVYCLPEGFTVQDWTSKVTTIAGNGTVLRSITRNADRRNCVTVSAFVRGSGVDKIGPVIVNHKGRGWLGADIELIGTKD